jgi:hypothetical protein
MHGLGGAGNGMRVKSRGREWDESQESGQGMEWKARGRSGEGGWEERQEAGAGQEMGL